MNKRKRNTGHQLNNDHHHDVYADDSHESLRTIKIASDAMNNADYNITNNNNNYGYSNRSRNGGNRRRKRPRDLKLSSGGVAESNSFDVVSNSSSYTNIHMENSPCPPTHDNNVCSNVTILSPSSSTSGGDDDGVGNDAGAHRHLHQRQHQAHGGEQGESANVLGKVRFVNLNVPSH